MENMKPVNWNTEKNIRLKAERGVSFEEVLSAMSHEAFLMFKTIQMQASTRTNVCWWFGFAAMPIWCRLWKLKVKSS